MQFLNGSVVRESEFKSEDPGFDPLLGQGEENHFSPSESTLVQTCLCLNPFLCTARTQICAHVKDPISIFRKRLGLTASGMETRKHCTQVGGMKTEMTASVQESKSKRLKMNAF